MYKAGIGIEETTRATETYMLINILCDFFRFRVFILKLKNSEVFRKPKIKACNSFIHVTVIKCTTTLS